MAGNTWSAGEYWAWGQVGVALDTVAVGYLALAGAVAVWAVAVNGLGPFIPLADSKSGDGTKLLSRSFAARSPSCRRLSCPGLGRAPLDRP